jgi:hypothetical protein
MDDSDAKPSMVPIPQESCQWSSEIVLAFAMAAKTEDANKDFPSFNARVGQVLEALVLNETP